MNGIVKVDFKGAAKSLASLMPFDALSNDAQAVVDNSTRIRNLLDGEPATLQEADNRIGALRALRPCEEHVTGLVRQIAGVLEPATEDQVRVELALFVGAFPSSNAPDPIVYSRMMLHEVTAAAPSMIALAAACSELRRTCKWPPPIADVLKAIRTEEVRWRHRFLCASEILGAHAKALEQLKEARAWLARPEEQKKAEQQEWLRRFQSLNQLITAGAAERSLGLK